jgi:hypothetical protein
LASVPQTLASRIGYPGFVVAAGIGWLLLLDLSANGQPGNVIWRSITTGIMACNARATVLAFLRPTLRRSLAWLLSVIDSSAAGRPLARPAACPTPNRAPGARHRRGYRRRCSQECGS